MFEELAAPFPRKAISWRAQSLTSNGDKAMALAYIDARDVMNRLDEVLTPGGWQDSYTETASGRVLCTLSVEVQPGVWVSKTDGAGNTDVEADKGGISDAFKRAAVKWGIGRYLYDVEAPWVPCSTYEKNGKKYWKAWTGDPWAYVKNAPADAPRVVPNDTNPTENEPGGAVDQQSQWVGWVNTQIAYLRAAEAASDGSKVQAWKTKFDDALHRLKAKDVELYDRVIAVFDDVTMALRPNYMAAG
jgi:hypothetical protein